MHAHDRDCPACGAPAGYYCNRPNGTAQKTPHKARHPRKRDNATDAEPYYHYEMEGYGEFPLDMLRYDNARFASVNDERIARNSDLGARVVGIISRQQPTLARWRSFGWELYRMYNSTGAPAYPYDGEGVTPKPWITGYKTRDNNRGARPNPNFIQFINKQTGNADSFPKIDDQICAFLGVKPDPDQYYLGWYDTIAFLAAMGKTFDQIREDRYVASQPVLLRILDWLDARYTPSAWAGR